MSETEFVVEWRDTVGFQKYQISNEGKVRNVRTGNEVKPTYDGDYWRINLMEDVRDDKGKFSRRHVAVHRLVAQAFIPQNDERQKYIDHIDSNRDNYDIKNLRWATPGQNTTYGHDTRGRKVVLQLDLQGNLIKRWTSATAIKEAHPDYNIGHISSVCLKRKGSHSHKGFKWAYETETVKKEVRDLHDDEELVNIGTFDEYDFQDYFVSNYGMIKNARGMVLTPFDDRGYMACTLYDKSTGKQHQVFAHRAVAFKFCSGRTPEKNIVNHKNEKRDDNYFRNVEWLSSRENAEYSLAKAVNQLTIGGAFICNHKSLTQAAEVAKTTPSAISHALTDDFVTAGGYKWEYAT